MGGKGGRMVRMLPPCGKSKKGLETDWKSE